MRRRYFLKVSIRLLLLFFLWCSRSIFASDIAIDVRAAGGETDPGNGGYFEVGAGIDFVYLPEDIPGQSNTVTDYYAFVGGAYRYNGFFFEGVDGTLDGINFGYQLWNNHMWSIDLLVSSFSGVINEDGEALEDMFDEGFCFQDEFVSEEDFFLCEYYLSMEETPSNPQILRINQNTFYNGAGLRATAYLDDYVFQYRLVTDVHGGNGVTSTARLGRHWQIRNWNFHGIIGLAYASEVTNEYLWGVTLEDETGNIQSFSPGNTVTLQTEVGVVYPLSQNWVFRSFLRYIDTPDQPDDSPIIVDDYEVLFATTISYVF